MKHVLCLLLFMVATMGTVQNSHAAPIAYDATLDGATQGTPSPGIGSALVVIDVSAHTLEVDVTFSGLLAPTTMAHIHAPTAVPGTGTAGVAVALTSAGFPLGVTSGTYDYTFDTALDSTYNSAFEAASGGTAADAEAALAASLAAGTAYVNIHTTLYPGGEISGFLEPVPTPVPGAILLFAPGLVGFATVRRRFGR